MRIISVTLGQPILYLYWILTPLRPGRDSVALVGGGVFNSGSGERNFTSEFKTRNQRLLQ